MTRSCELAILLQAHVPYVEGFGAGEESLRDSIERSYVPLLDVLGRARMTLSLSPVLCDQLEAVGPPGLLEALAAHATWTSAATHAILPLLASDTLIAVQVQRRNLCGWVD